MSNETEHNPETDGINYAESENTITITICGRPLDNLRKIAPAMNSMDWWDGDTTPLSVLDFIVGDSLHNLGQPKDKTCKIHFGCVGEITDLIVDGIDTGYDWNTPEDDKRKATLRAAFDRLGV